MLLNRELEIFSFSSCTTILKPRYLNLIGFDGPDYILPRLPPIFLPLAKFNTNQYRCR